MHLVNRAELLEANRVVMVPMNAEDWQSDAMSWVQIVRRVLIRKLYRLEISFRFFYILGEDLLIQNFTSFEVGKRGRPMLMKDVAAK